MNNGLGAAADTYSGGTVVLGNMYVNTMRALGTGNVLRCAGAAAIYSRRQRSRRRQDPHRRRPQRQYGFQRRARSLRRRMGLGKPFSDAGFHSHDRPGLHRHTEVELR